MRSIGHSLANPPPELDAVLNAENAHRTAVNNSDGRGTGAFAHADVAKRKAKLEQAEAEAAPVFAKMPEGARDRFAESASAHTDYEDTRAEYQRRAKFVKGAPKRQQALADAEAARAAGDREGYRKSIARYSSLIDTHTEGFGLEDAGDIYTLVEHA